MSKNADVLSVKEKTVMCLAVVVIFFVFSFFANGCHAFNDHFDLPDDHVGEQVLEAIIKDKTGLDLDLSLRESL